MRMSRKEIAASCLESTSDRETKVRYGALFCGDGLVLRMHKRTELRLFPRGVMYSVPYDII